MCAVLLNIREKVSHGSKTLTTLGFSQVNQGVCVSAGSGFEGIGKKIPVMIQLLE
jgi:hypothetical protein